MISTVDPLTAIGTHLNVFELPASASVHGAAAMSRPQVTVQLSCRTPSAIALGLLAWAGTLIEVTAQVWRIPHGDLVHLLVTGLLPDGADVVRVYGGMRIIDCSLGIDLVPDGIRTLRLVTLRHLSTPGQLMEEVTL
ncbi:MAG: hypothetical protein JO309_15015 [Pseudonocardiales bacterium]|nr:hypothetical protein [Pseudonocardiales bacterium]MBV9730681.1 hypothetical protein [Pseudonocardiales bacterium]